MCVKGCRSILLLPAPLPPARATVACERAVDANTRAGSAQYRAACEPKRVRYIDVSSVLLTPPTPPIPLSHIAFLRISHHPFPHFPPTHTLTHKSLQANE